MTQPGATACVMNVRGDNKPFKLSLLTCDGFGSVNYQAGFATSGTEWQTVSLSLARRISLAPRDPRSTSLTTASHRRRPE
jgi:hypothetical protein